MRNLVNLTNLYPKVYYLFLLMLITRSFKIDAQYVDCTKQITDDREIRILTPEDIIKKRFEIIRSIWNTNQIPGRSDVIVTPDIISPLTPETSVARVDKIEIPAQIPVVKGSEPIKDLAYLFVPIHRNNRLMIVHHGHSCKFKDAQPGDSSSGYRMEATIIGLLKAGYDVLAVYMPHISETNCSLNHCEVINTNLGYKNHLATYGLRLFLEPTIVSLNYLLQKNPYQYVDMIGLSGGGWTTTLIAAIDDRIKYSFPVAGSIPLYYRWGDSVGDIEQYLPQLYRDIAGYPDLYILGSYGKGRKQVQILNRYDNCCFGQKQYDPARDYASDLHTYENAVKERLVTLGAGNQYYLVIDEVALSHQISGFALNNIILPELDRK
jgi:hypothetical protein